MMITKGQEIALQNHLTFYPSDKNFIEIINMLRDDHEDVGMWEHFVEWNIYEFCKHLIILSDQIDSALENSKNENH